MQEELNWHVETACRQAWPSPREIPLQGWLLRLSGGTTRRTSSANPTGEAVPVAQILPEIRQTYRHAGQTPLFRIPTFLPAFEAELTAAGFVSEGETCTLFAPLEGSATEALSEVRLEPAPSPAWVAAKKRLTPMGPDQAHAYDAMLSKLALPTAFASVTYQDQVVSVAYGAIAQGLLVIESVVTDTDFRGRGLAAATVGALMDWAYQAGVKAACLQVVAGNEPAHALYRKLGFRRELYRYNYWCET